MPATLREIEHLQTEVDKRLGLNHMRDSRRYRKTGGKLLDDNKRFANAVLAYYDWMHGSKLLQEAKTLDASSGTVSNVSIPAAFERTVLREAVYNLVGLQFVDYGVAEFSETLYIPYSYRKGGLASTQQTRTYEGGSIQRASVVQSGDTAYPIPQKLSFEVSDELRYLTSSKQLNWEVVAENQANATRIVGEDTDRLIFNEQLQASDEFQTSQVQNEDLSSQLTDGKTVALLGGDQVTTVCRPRKLFDLQGEQVGNTVNPVKVVFDGVEIAEFNPFAFDENGNSTLPVGHYYVLDYDIGEIWLTDQNGSLIDPTGKSLVISYSKVSNVGYFDIDIPAGTKAKEHWDGFLRLYGLRKSLIEDSRYYQATFGLMSGNAMNEIEQAEKFQASNRVPSTDLSVDGSLGRIKDIPNFKTTAPGLWMGDRRVLLGEGGTTRLRLTKPWELNQLENQKDANGRFTGKKEAYGDQFLVLHTPTPLKAAFTSIVLYSKSQRVSRVHP